MGSWSTHAKGKKSRTEHLSLAAILKEWNKKYINNMCYANASVVSNKNKFQDITS